jgi:heme-binding HmuY-like protein
MGRFIPALAVAGLVLGVVTLVALTLHQPMVPTYAPTPAAPHDVGATLVGPVVYTVDATAPEAWRAFSFRLGSVVESTSGDLAFRRYSIVAGPGAAIRDLGETAFDDIRVVPADGYVANESRGEPRNPAIASWYQYGFFTHVLSPKPRVWAVRTADARYAKMQIVGYYCPGARPGCLTFRYVYQGDGSTQVETPSGRVSWQSTRSR